MSIDPGLTSFDPTRPGGLSTIHHSSISAPSGQAGFGPIDFATIIPSSVMPHQGHQHGQHTQQQHVGQQQQQQQLHRHSSHQQQHRQQQQQQQQQPPHTAHPVRRQCHIDAPNRYATNACSSSQRLSQYQQGSRDGDSAYFTVPYHMSSISPPSTNWQQHQQHQQQRVQDGRNRRSDLDTTLFNPGPAVLQQAQSQLNSGQQQHSQRTSNQLQQQMGNGSGNMPPPGTTSLGQAAAQLTAGSATATSSGNIAGQASTTPGSQTSGGLSAAGTVPATGAGNTIVSPSGESQSSYDSTQNNNNPNNTNRPHRKRHHHHHHHHRDGTGGEDRIADPEVLAAAKLRNPVDALDLLIQAADTRGKGGGEGKGSMTSPENPDGHHHHHSHHGEGGDTSMRGITGGGEANERSGVMIDNKGGTSYMINHDDDAISSGSATPPPFTLADFPLVKKGIVSTIELIYFVNLFFNKIHHIFPIVPHHRIPTTEASLTAFARGELAHSFLHRDANKADCDGF